MSDYHAIQLTGSKCQGRNCACASGAMAVAFGTDNRVTQTADQFRHESGVSCIPGVETPSGGLFIGDVRRVCYQHGVHIDYGVGPGGYYRWPATIAKHMLSSDHGGIFLGDYDQIHAPYRAPSSSFQGDHSAWSHDYRKSDNTVCWHDPLRLTPIRIPLGVLLAYWQKPGSPVKGLAGFVLAPQLVWGAEVPASIRAMGIGQVSSAVKLTGVSEDHWTGVINLGDIGVALDAIGHDYKSKVDPSDVLVLVAWAKAH